MCQSEANQEKGEKAYNFYVFKVLHIGHLSLDQFKNDTITDTKSISSQRSQRLYMEKSQLTLAVSPPSLVKFS